MGFNSGFKGLNFLTLKLIFTPNKKKICSY